MAQSKWRKVRKEKELSKREAKESLMPKHLRKKKKHGRP